MICEVAYRLKRKGIRELKDLKGRKIGSLAGSSADVFVCQVLGSRMTSIPLLGAMRV
jgi:ABC-type amino acid transport substrate-binding protein